MANENGNKIKLLVLWDILYRYNMRISPDNTPGFSCAFYKNVA